MDKEIVKIIKTLKGNVLGIGLTKKMVDAIENNDEITECNLLNSYVKEEKKKGKRKRLKTIKIKKLHKYFKKKSVDCIICNYETIQKYMNTFVKNSVYINCGDLYFFGALDKDLLTTRYRRYHTNVSFIDNKEGSIATIDNEKTKNHKIKELGYRIIDGVTSTMDIIGDILMN